MNGKDILNKFNVGRDLNTNFVVINGTPNVSVTNSDFDFDEVAIKDFEDYILYFLRTIKKDFSLEDLTIFFNNLKELSIKRKDINIKEGSAVYSASKKEITLTGENYMNDVYHELFHVASSFVQSGNIYSGFYQGHWYLIKTIGRGLTEGYTEKLAEDYFGDTDKIGRFYAYEVYVARIIEQIIGEDVMKKLYVRANLPELIRLLSVYVSEKEVIGFLNSLDFVEKYRKATNINKVAYEVLREAFRSVTFFLIKIYVKKLVVLVGEGMEYEIFNEMIWNFVNGLCLEFNSFGTYFEIMKYEEVQEYLKNILRNEKIVLIDEGIER